MTSTQTPRCPAPINAKGEKRGNAFTNIWGTEPEPDFERTTGVNNTNLLRVGRKVTEARRQPRHLLLEADSLLAGRSRPHRPDCDHEPETAY